MLSETLGKYPRIFPELYVNMVRSGPTRVWACTDKQKALILKIVDDHHLDKNGIESLAMDRFKVGVWSDVGSPLPLEIVPVGPVRSIPAIVLDATHLLERACLKE